jgi:hypothetical protein
LWEIARFCGKRGLLPVENVVELWKSLRLSLIGYHPQLGLGWLLANPCPHVSLGLSFSVLGAVLEKGIKLLLGNVREDGTALDFLIVLLLERMNGHGCVVGVMLSRVPL